MAITVGTVVTDALFLSLYDRQLGPPISGGDMDWALYMMQYLLDEWRDLIPYTAYYSFNNVDQLTNTQFVQVDNVSYVLPGLTTKYPLIAVTNEQWIRQNLVINLKAIPNIYWFDPLAQTINVYPGPSQTSYQFIVYGRPAMIAQYQYALMPDNMPIYMISALKYELAFRLAGERGILFNDYKMKTKQETFDYLWSKREIDISPADNTEMTSNPAQTSPYPIWAVLSGTSAG